MARIFRRRDPERFDLLDSASGFVRRGVDSRLLT